LSGSTEHKRGARTSQKIPGIGFKDGGNAHRTMLDVKVVLGWRRRSG
jgi:hypothetical protein